MRTFVRLGLTLLAAVLVGAWLHACANSILRNATEAGIETVLEDPLPTPTAVAPPRRSAY